MPASSLRRSLEGVYNVSLTQEALYSSLAILERRGLVSKISTGGARILWAVRLGDARPAVARHTDEPPAVRNQPRVVAPGTDCIKLMRPDGVLVHMNRPGCIALGLPEGEIEFGMPWLELLPSALRPMGMRALRGVTEGRRERFIGVTFDPDGSPRYWDNELTPIEDDSRNISEILCISRDVTNTVNRTTVETAPNHTRVATTPGVVSSRRAVDTHELPPKSNVTTSFAHRLNRLFTTITAPGCPPFTNADVRRALAARGVTISQPYLSQLRTGRRPQPPPRLVDALAEFFGVSPAYFTPEYGGQESRYLAALDSDLTWLHLSRNGDVRQLTELIQLLPDHLQEELLDTLDDSS